ncbi:hypothetical protein ONE63_005490 [Megalurothrips usitatus]|uniref:UBA domain-containing protein n=1 Tax=Megalurothrips usitatus TaxID=439358 RepID=A0AAV7XZ50_9NEOP|nr:hypothetical protein ONE63_005490 [Megalurothrips usitatus]
MKIDRSRLKKSTSEVPIECQALIEKLRSCSPAELLEELKRIDSWTFGKCELYHWIDILDICDGILEEAAMRAGENTWTLACDLPHKSELKELLLWVLNFTTLLIEHSFSRHLYNSMERLVALLSSCDMHVVLGVLNLLYMFSKRSNFITRLDSDKRQALLSRLTHLAESWGGRDNGFGLADCCKDHPISHFPSSSTTLHFEFYPEDSPAASTTSGATAAPTATISGAHPPPTIKPKGISNPTSVIHIPNIDALDKTPAQIMDQLLTTYAVPKDKQMVLFTHLRLAHSFSNYQRRLQCVQARLQALSVLVYSNALADNSHSLLYPGLMEELVELLEIASPDLVEIRAAALRTLTSIIHLDRNPNFPHRKPGARLNMIIDVTGAASYHGFLPVLVRTCIASLTAPANQASTSSSTEPAAFPLPLATALFSFLYHLASYEAGGEALVSCGMMESLLRVINWPGSELEHITFVTRAVRVIDLITNIEMQAFQAHGGLTSFINRLEMEVNTCRIEQPFEIIPPGHQPHDMDEEARLGDSAQSLDAFDDQDMETESPRGEEDGTEAVGASGESSQPQDGDQTDKQGETDDDSFPNFDYSAAKTGRTCLPQRAALLKSMLNFLKKAIQVEDPAFSDSIRRVMEGSLPSSLKHIISNAEYYGPSLFLLATDVVTVYVFQEPSLLSSLQDNGLTDVVLHALLVKEVPATKEVLGSLPNMFSALCLNTRGLQAFQKCQPFPRIFKVLISPAYLAAMRRRRSSEPMGDTAASLGNAMDELMRHQPTLKQPAMGAIVKLLEELCALGRNPKYVCWRAQNKQEVSPAAVPNNQGSGSSSSNTEGNGSSDEDDEDEEEASSSSHQPQSAVEASAISSSSANSSNTEKTPIALIDYIINVMKFVDAILSNNSTDDHCREFVNQSGLEPLLSVLGLPNLPVDYPVTTAAQSVSAVCKSILNLAHDQHVLQQGLLQLSDVLHTLRPLYTSRSMGGLCSVLLQELVRAPSLENAFSTPSATPLLHAMTAANGYVVMFVHVCRTGQVDVRAISVRSWGSELGLAVLKALSELYVSLVWESTLLLALCSDDILPPGSDFGKEDMEKLRPSSEQDGAASGSALADGSNGMTSAMEALTTTEQLPGSSMEVEGAASAAATAGPSRVSRGTTCCGTTPTQLKYIKPLLGASSRLGRALAELFGLLVKLCVGSPIRPRRTQPGPNAPAQPTPCARAVATSLNCLLARGLNYSLLPSTPIPKLRLTFLICSVGFTTPMLFDEKKYPYHLMLQNFASFGGLENFFETFRWALSAGYTIPLEEGLESPDLPEGTGEFLDAWLLLLEKMVNPRAILESPHAINKVSSTQKPFDPYQYLSNIHKMAFDAVMLMWGKKPLKTYGARMSESMLAILRHILRGEKLMQEKQLKDEEAKKTETADPGASSSGVARRPGEPTVPQINQDHLRSLIDMGFCREVCEEALLQCTTLEQATDYVLNHPTPHTRSTSAVPAVDAEIHPEVFKATAERLLRVDINLHKSRFDVEDTRLLLKCIPTGPHTPVPMHEKVSQSVIYDLLNALAREPVKKEESSTSPSTPVCMLQDEQLQTDNSIAQPSILAAEVSDGNISAATQFNAGTATAAVQLFVPREIPQDLLAEGAATAANSSQGVSVPTGGDDAKKGKDDLVNFSAQQEQIHGVNNMVRIMLRRGLVTDLARVVHSLDLSSPNTASTVNACLKPLETLSRIMAQPSLGSALMKLARSKIQSLEVDPLALPGTPTSGATHAQGEDAAEDPDNTDHDVSGATESMEPNSESRQQQEGDEPCLDDLMDVLVSRERQGSTSSAFVNQTEAMDVEARDDELLSSCHRNTLFTEQEDHIDDESSDSGSNQSAEGLDRDNDDILMIQYSDPDPSGPLVPWNTNASFGLPFGLFDDATNGNNDAGSGLNPGAHIHPLLNTRHSNESNNLSNTRGQRTNRQRRYQYLHLNMRNPNPPVILQRLLGPLTGTIPLAAAATQALANSVRDSRVVLMDHGLGILTNAEEEQIDFVDQSAYLLGPGVAVTMNNTPTALNWWNEESKLLDGECSADLVFVVAHSLVGNLKKYRDEELHERQQKLKKQVEEQKKSEELARKKRAAKGEAEPGKEQGMEVQSIPASLPVNPNPDLESPSEGAPSDLLVQEQNATNCMLESIANYLVPGAGGSSDQSPASTAAGSGIALPPPPEDLPPSWLADPRLAAAAAAAALRPPPRDAPESPAAAEVVSIPDTPASPDQTEAGVPAPSTSGAEAAPQAGPEREDAPEQQQQPPPPPPPQDEVRAQASAQASGQEALAAAMALAEAAVPSTSSERPALDSAAAASTATSGVPELPEGVDPSFLAALPEDMREEVIAEQLRLQRIRQQTMETQSQAGTGITQVNPEFLAALPPAIQEEVLSQQRLEQQRHAAASANPEDPMDTAAFFQNLQPALRQAILADMEDSQISALPPDLAAEAQNLRREWESRNRHMHDRFFTSHPGPSTLSQILRSQVQAASGSRRPVARYAIQTVPQQSRWMTGSWTDREQAALALTSTSGTNIRTRGRPLLDHEALACLLVLLFLDEPRLNTGRLHRVFRNLCYHYQTRDWIIKALLSILERSNESRVTEIQPALPSSETPAKSKRTTRASQAKQAADASKGGAGGSGGNSAGANAKMPGGTSWLNVSVDAALGCRANIFNIQRPPSGKRGYERSNNSSAITVHRQAAPIVCRHVLDLLISLGKSFPGYFIPARPKDQETPPERVGVETRSRASSSQGAASTLSGGEGTSSGPSTSTPGPSSGVSTGNQNEFWDLLLRLDSASSSRKGKNLSRSNSSAGVERNNESDSAHPTNFEASAFGQLLPMLDCEVIKRSTVLTDKLLRLLSLVSVGLGEPNPSGPPMVENQVRLAVQVLTSKTCSEEGLEDTTALLLNLAGYSDAMREMILRLLLEGAMKLAYTVQEHIAALIGELSNLNQKRVREDSTSTDDNPATRQERGLLHDRFTNDTVVVTAPSKLKGGMDLQLPSMVPLTSKTSSQAFFLRILKVIIQLRDAVRLASKKKPSRFEVQSHSTPGAAAAAAAVAAAASAAAAAAAAAATAAAAGTAPSAPPSAQADAVGSSVERMDTDVPAAAAAPSVIQPVPAPAPTSAPAATTASGEDAAAAAAASGTEDAGSSQSLPDAKPAVAAQPPAETPRAARGRGYRAGRTGRRANNQAAAAAAATPQDQADVAGTPAPVEGDAMDTSSPPGAPQSEFEQPLPPEYQSNFHFINPASQQTSQDDLVSSEDDDEDEADEDEEAEGEQRPPLPNLSEQLRLDDLWETLSTCLLQLADTPDHHAVLMLQPAVEAFFLVHAPPPSDRERERSSSSSNRANPGVDLVADVPAGRLGSQGQPQAAGQPAGTASTSGDEVPSTSLALESAVPAPVLSPDQQKFLKFAGL